MNGVHFIIGMEGVIPSIDFLNFIKEYKIGGILLLGKNFKDRETLIDSINTIQNHHKCIISIDHEGGRVQRLKEGFTLIPSFRELSNTKTSKEIFEFTIKIASELKEVGINLNFAPVADMINSTTGAIGDRSVGTDLDKVCNSVSSYIRGSVKAGLMCCVKHFPGHGVVEEDSHLILPESDKTLDELLNYEIIPFKKAIKSGVDGVMTSHILFKNIDSLPASLSKVFIDIIRNEWRFKKLIISDDLSMLAIKDNYGISEAAKLALNAGTDLLIYSSSNINELANIIDSIDIKHTESKERINSAINKIT